MMRRGALLLVVALVSMLGGYGPASADCGAGGSPTNGSGSCETAAGQVQCGPGTETPVGLVSAGLSGAEYCNSQATLPVQGRIGAQQDCSCVYVDGDNDNNRSLLLNGWVRVDSTGAHCRQRGVPNDHSYNSSQGTDTTGCVTQFLP